MRRTLNALLSRKVNAMTTIRTERTTKTAQTKGNDMTTQNDSRATASNATNRARQVRTAKGNEMINRRDSYTATALTSRNGKGVGMMKRILFAGMAAASLFIFSHGAGGHDKYEFKRNPEELGEYNSFQVSFSGLYIEGSNHSLTNVQGSAAYSTLSAYASASSQMRWDMRTYPGEYIAQCIVGEGNFEYDLHANAEVWAASAGRDRGKTGDETYCSGTMWTSLTYQINIDGDMIPHFDWGGSGSIWDTTAVSGTAGGSYFHPLAHYAYAASRNTLIRDRDSEKVMDSGTLWSVHKHYEKLKF